MCRTERRSGRVDTGRPEEPDRSASRRTVWQVVRTGSHLRSTSGGNGAVLDDLDETIKTVLRERGGLPTAEVDIAFDAPDREWSGRINRPTVNCYLYDIRENLELRESGWTTERDLNGRR